MSDRIVAFAGSLRATSYNRALLRAARELAPESMHIEIIEIGGLPFYNADLEAAGDPPPVIAFKQALAAADGVLIASPEYNDGIPGSWEMPWTGGRACQDAQRSSKCRLP